MPGSDFAAEFQAATAMAAENRHSEALAHLNVCLRLEPKSGEALLLRGVTYYKLDRALAALDDLQRAVKLLPGDARARSNLAVVLYEIGRLPAAREAAEAALALDPTDPTALGVRRQLEEDETQGTFWHQFPWLARHERLWTSVGLLLFALGIAVTVALAVVVPFTPPDPNQSNPLNASIPKTDSVSLTAIFGWLAVCSVSIVWLVVDMVDRRSRFLWLMPQVVCGICGAPWVPLGIYLWIGREKSA
jgi:tetratricopeptide (TPR) repeat protein